MSSSHNNHNPNYKNDGYIVIAGNNNSSANSRISPNNSLSKNSSISSKTNLKSSIGVGQVYNKKQTQTQTVRTAKQIRKNTLGQAKIRHILLRSLNSFGGIDDLIKQYQTDFSDKFDFEIVLPQIKTNLELLQKYKKTKDRKICAKASRDFMYLRNAIDEFYKKPRAIERERNRLANIEKEFAAETQESIERSQARRSAR